MQALWPRQKYALKTRGEQAFDTSSNCSASFWGPNVLKVRDQGWPRYDYWLYWCSARPTVSAHRSISCVSAHQAHLFGAVAILKVNPGRQVDIRTYCHKVEVAASKNFKVHIFVLSAFEFLWPLDCQRTCLDGFAGQNPGYGFNASTGEVPFPGSEFVVPAVGRGYVKDISLCQCTRIYVFSLYLVPGDSVCRKESPSASRRQRVWICNTLYMSVYVSIYICVCARVYQHQHWYYHYYKYCWYVFIVHTHNIHIYT